MDGIHSQGLALPSWILDHGTSMSRLGRWTGMELEYDQIYIEEENKPTILHRYTCYISLGSYPQPPNSTKFVLSSAEFCKVCKHNKQKHPGLHQFSWQKHVSKLWGFRILIITKHVHQKFYKYVDNLNSIDKLNLTCKSKIYGSLISTINTGVQELPELKERAI